MSMRRGCHDSVVPAQGSYCESVSLARHSRMSFVFFFLNDPATPETSTLPLHAALPICPPFPLGVTRSVDALRATFGNAIGRGLEQRAAPDVDDRVAARLEPAADRIAEGRPQRVDGRVHAERNWWTEFPNGSEISSISSGGRRKPRSSSGCSSRRGT